MKKELESLRSELAAPPDDSRSVEHYRSRSSTVEIVDGVTASTDNDGGSTASAPNKRHCADEADEVRSLPHME